MGRMKELFMQFREEMALKQNTPDPFELEEKEFFQWVRDKKLDLESIRLEKAIEERDKHEIMLIMSEDVPEDEFEDLEAIGDDDDLLNFNLDEYE